MQRRGFLGGLLALVLGWKVAKGVVEPPVVTSGYLQVDGSGPYGSMTTTVGSFPDPNASWVDIELARAPWTYTDPDVLTDLKKAL